MKGYVYVLTNPVMPGLVKIGRSKNAAGSRAKQLYRGDTGVPLPFDIYFECMFSNCIEGEALVHEELDEHRINPAREFFRIEPWDAQKAVMRVCSYEIDCTVVEFGFTVCDAEMALVAHKFNLCPPEPYQIVDFVSDGAWREAIAAYRKRFPKRVSQTTTGLTLVDATGGGDLCLAPVDCQQCGVRTTEYTEVNSVLMCEQCYQESVEDTA